MDLSIIILAAGNGTRMKSKTAKILHKISGQTMISHIINKSLELSNDVKIVLGYKFEEVKEEILKEFPQIEIIKQDTINYPGTAGAVMAAAKQIKNKKTLIICGDMPLVETKELENLCELESDLGLSAFRSANPFGYGRVILDGEKVVKIVEEKDANDEEKKVNLCNAGAYTFKTSLLQEILPKISNQNKSNEYYLTDAISLAIENENSVKYALVDEENFMGVNDKFALSKAEILHQNKIKEKLMKDGIIMHLPSSIFIDSRAKFIGECELENGVRIEGASVIENSLIKANSVIENSVIINSDLGPSAHIRPKCEIKNTHIGNFVECKNAKLNTIKAGHLSYLGDCEIDEGTNIGCGTITCNYDGVSKHKTIIGKNVFVGSDTQLIAPINIASDTIIAAGSTVTKNSFKGDLVIARSKQVNKSGYFYKIFANLKAMKND